MKSRRAVILYATARLYVIHKGSSDLHSNGTFYSRNTAINIYAATTDDLSVIQPAYASSRSFSPAPSPPAPFRLLIGVCLYVYTTDAASRVGADLLAGADLLLLVTIR